MDVILYLLVAADLVATDFTAVVTAAWAAAIPVTALADTIAAEAAADAVIFDETFCCAFVVTDAAETATAAGTALWLAVDRIAGDETAEVETTDFDSCIASATRTVEFAP